MGTPASVCVLRVPPGRSERAESPESSLMSYGPHHVRFIRDLTCIPSHHTSHPSCDRGQTVSQLERQIVEMERATDMTDRWVKEEGKQTDKGQGRARQSAFLILRISVIFPSLKKIK